jgi:hypothetical protein
MRNPFRDKMMRKLYDEAIRAHDTQNKNFFHPSGRRNLGNSMSGMFWRGHDGIGADKWDAPSRRMVAYAYWCAGRDVRNREGRG